MRIFYCFIISLSLLACSPSENRILTAVKKAISEHYPEPDTIQYKDISVYRNIDDATICGEFNAKNSNGEFIGYQPFVSQVVISDNIDILSINIRNRNNSNSFPSLICENHGYEGAKSAQDRQRQEFMNNINKLAVIEENIHDESVRKRVVTHLINRAKEIYDSELSADTLKIVDNGEGRYVSIIAYKKGNDIYFTSLLNSAIYDLEPFNNNIVKYIHTNENDKNLAVIGNYDTEIEDDDQEELEMFILAREILENGIPYANTVLSAKN